MNTKLRKEAEFINNLKRKLVETKNHFLKLKGTERKRAKIEIKQLREDIKYSIKQFENLIKTVDQFTEKDFTEYFQTISITKRNLCTNFEEEAIKELVDLMSDLALNNFLSQ